MPSTHPIELDVFSVREIAMAADVSAAAVHELLAAGAVGSTSGFVHYRDAVHLVRTARMVESGAVPRPMFAGAPRRRDGSAPILLSGAVHAGFVILALVAGTVGAPTAARTPRPQDTTRLVFLATPGPGGGGGGGGLRQAAPPRAARLKGRSAVSSPVSVARRAEPLDAEQPVEPLPVPRDPDVERVPRESAPGATPPVTAPVVSGATDSDDAAGVVTNTHSTAESRGPGDADGSGSGRGGGSGEGDGRGIGDGSIAGTGGGPYRPGSGITPPSLQREVKPVYTEEARRRGIEGDVVMEVVIRTDGSVGGVRITRALGAGLDERAVDAVRQWQFLPARRLGTPVDVLVEIAVEFRLR